MNTSIITSFALLMMISFLLIVQDINAFNCDKVEIVSKSRFYEYGCFGDDISNKEIFDTISKVSNKAKNSDMQYHKLENETIICIKSEVNRRWRFWKWKSDYNIISASGRLINTDAPIYVFEFYRSGDKKPFYKYSIDIDKWDSYNYEFFSIKDAFVINNILFNIKNGSVEKIREDIVEVGKKHLVFLEKGEKPFLYVGDKDSVELVDFFNKPLNNDKYKSQKFIDIEILNAAGETETKKRMELSENVYVNQKGDNFLIGNWEQPFPKRIKHFAGDNKTERIIGSIDNAVVLPDTPYFLIYSRATYGFYLIDKEGNWIDKELLKKYFIERNTRGGESKIIVYKLNEEDYDGTFHIINR